MIAPAVARRFLSLEFFPMIGYTVIPGGHAQLAVPSAGNSGSAEMISGRALQRVGRWRAGPATAVNAYSLAVRRHAPPSE
jgi:hypothetical protein